MKCKALIDGKWEICTTLGHNQLNGKTFYTVKYGSLILSFPESKIKFS